MKPKLTDYSYIQELLTKYGFRFSKSLGQNFLTADYVPVEIAEAADLSEDTQVVEVGPGFGCLTVELSSRAGRVTSYELDETLMPVLQETLSGCENVEVVFRDYMKEKLPPREGKRVFCANIPYNITSPLLTKVLTEDYDRITVMIQKEVAHRICAGPGSPDYSSFGILCQWYTEPEILFEVPRDCFIPQPKVDSAVITMKRRLQPPVITADEQLMFRIIRAAFNFRRKTLVNALSSGLSMDKEEARAAVLSANLPETVRGEALSLAQFAELANIIKK